MVSYLIFYQLTHNPVATSIQAPPLVMQVTRVGHRPVEMPAIPVDQQAVVVVVAAVMPATQAVQLAAAAAAVATEVQPTLVDRRLVHPATSMFLRRPINSNDQAAMADSTHNPDTHTNKPYITNPITLTQTQNFRSEAI